MNSMNHYAYGAIVEWVYKYVCGLNPTEDAPGYKRAVLKPQPDKRLGAAKAKVNSAAGYYESGWAYNGDDVTYTFVVPFDAEAEVILLDKNGEEVRKTLTAGEHIITL